MRRLARKEPSVDVQMRPAPRRPNAESIERRIPLADDKRVTPDTATLSGLPGFPGSSPGRRRRRARRRILAVAGVLILIPLLILGVQAYRIIDAIGHAQNTAFIPLPTRVPQSAVQATNPDPGSPASGSGTPVVSLVPVDGGQTPAVDATAAAAGDGTGAQGGVAVAAPTVPSSSAGGAAPAGGPSAGDGDESMSSFDVVRELAEAGTDRGDPGLDGVWDGKTELTMMVLGVDRRADGGDQNADVIMLVRLDLVDKSIQAVSIPRDLLVEIPNHGAGKINGAYNIGVQEHPDHPAAGVAMMRDTIEDNFGVVIDNYVLLDFRGFEAAIDAVGGVEVTVPYRIQDDAYPTDDYGTEVVIFEPGLQEMDGETALKYARTRNVDSDDGRRERQADILLALFDEAKDLGSITQANNIIVALGDSVQTSFQLEQQLMLARIGLEMDRAAIGLEAIPETMLTEGYDANGAWVYFADIASVATFIQGELGLSTVAAG